MKILVVSQYFYPEQFRINDICFQLCTHGNKVTVLTGLPNYPTGEVFDGYCGKANSSEAINGVLVYRCKLRPRHTGTKNLILNYFSFVQNSKKMIKRIRKDYDVVFVYGVSPILQALPALKIKKKFNIPVYYYCLDLWPESVLGEQNGHKTISRHNLFYIISKIISKSIYKKVDRIGVKCNYFSHYLSSCLNIPLSKIGLLYEHAETLYLNVSPVPKHNGIIDFMFLGNIGKIQNCNQILFAFSKLVNKKSAHLHFVGNGSELENIKREVFNLNLSQFVSFYNQCSVEEVINFYNLADVCVLTLSNKTSTGYTPPGKLFSYLAASRPIIASIDGEAADIIRESNCGYVCGAGDVLGLSELMNEAIENQELLIRMGQNGREYFKSRFMIDAFIDNLTKEFNSIIESK